MLKFPGPWFQLIQGSTWPKVNIVPLERYVEICILSEELWLCSPYPMPLPVSNAIMFKYKYSWATALHQVSPSRRDSCDSEHETHMTTYLVLMKLLIKKLLHLLLFNMVLNNSKYPWTCCEKYPWPYLHSLVPWSPSQPLGHSATPQGCARCTSHVPSTVLYATSMYDPPFTMYAFVRNELWPLPIPGNHHLKYSMWNHLDQQ